MMKRRRRINVLIVTLAALFCIPLTGCTPNGAGNIATFIRELALQATAAFLL
ncbi:MAG: hypothetical protein AAB363_08140 [Planctomycetota bacterium]